MALQFPLTFPASVAGIYALKNLKTSQIYIGETSCLVQRYAEWRAAVRGTTPARSSNMREVLGKTNKEDWVFIVLAELPNSSPQERKKSEQAAIRKMKDKIGPLLTNTMHVEIEPSDGANNTAKAATRLTYEGKPLTYAKAAEILGVRTHTLSKRLAKWRSKGHYSVRVEDLAEIGRGRPSKKLLIA